ncbi:c-type cytochrome [Seonamhaeicola maritimus]|uniref:c-type cytochrome n=1 Tax=Seonamhaeicola maritimus TaxID=2591822 RepID=UPI001478B11F|nr:cytochrome c [Seonamhaeicola maritimus]
MKKIVFIFALVVIFGLGSLYFVNKNRISVRGTQDPEPISSIRQILDDDILEGRRQFKINCTACHKLQGIVDPPLLQNNFKNYNLEKFQQFVKNEKRNRENMFGNTECMPFPDLSDKKIEYIYNYIAYSLN